MHEQLLDLAHVELPSPSLVHPHGRGQATARASCRGPGRDQGEHCVACVSMCAARLPCVAAVHGTLPCVCPVLRCPASQCAPRLMDKVFGLCQYGVVIPKVLFDDVKPSCTGLNVVLIYNRSRHISYAEICPGEA